MQAAGTLGPKRKLVWSEETLADVIDGKIRISSECGNVPYRLTSRQKGQLEQAKERGYLICTTKLQDLALMNAWFVWCELKQWPYVKVVEARQYAAVQMDLIAMPFKLSRERETSLREQVEGSLSHVHRPCCQINHCNAYVPKVPLADTPALAQLMLETGLMARAEASKNREVIASDDPDETSR